MGPAKYFAMVVQDLVSGRTVRWIAPEILNRHDNKADASLP